VCGDEETNSKDYHETLNRMWSKVKIKEIILKVAFNRTIRIQEANEDGTMVKFHFDELCKRNFGSSDFRAIANKFDVVVIEHIPRLTLKEHDQARRFITLVDELYEARCVLMCSASTTPDEIFNNYYNEDLEDNDQLVTDENILDTKISGSFGIDVAQSNGMTVGGMASVRELSFAFRRATSRIIQMSSKVWWERQQKGQGIM